METKPHIDHETYMRRMAEGLKQPDMVNEPPHYNKHGVEAIDAIQAATGDGFEYHLQATAIKYVWRYRYKGKPLEDLKKAAWYLNRLIELYEDKQR